MEQARVIGVQRKLKTAPSIVSNIATSEKTNSIRRATMKRNELKRTAIRNIQLVGDRESVVPKVILHCVKN